MSDERVEHWRCPECGTFDGPITGDLCDACGEVDDFVQVEQFVCLPDVLDWVTDWVPEPARPLWRQAFIERFGGVG